MSETHREKEPFQWRSDKTGFYSHETFLGYSLRYEPGSKKIELVSPGECRSSWPRFWALIPFVPGETKEEKEEEAWKDFVRSKPAGTIFAPTERELFVAGLRAPKVW